MTSKCPSNPATNITGLRYLLALIHTANYTQVKSDVSLHRYAAPPVFYVKPRCTMNCKQPVTEHAPVSQTTPIETNYVLQHSESNNTPQLTKQYMVTVQWKNFNQFLDKFLYYILINFLKISLGFLKLFLLRHFAYILKYFLCRGGGQISNLCF